MKYIATNIIWDTDGEEIDLPKEINIDIPNEDFIILDEEEIDEYISDYITGYTGFCHKGFSIK
jgi:hypothetical protein